MSVDLERKVRQLDNDVTAIYDILERIDSSQHKMLGVQRRQGNRLDELAAKLNEHSARFNEMDGKLNKMDSKLDQILATLNA